jgi:hypothetical protein
MENTTDTKPPASPPLPAPMGSVWIISWHHMDDESSGIHGVFASEDRANTVAVQMTRDTRGSIYTASQWMVTPNEQAHA